VSRTVAERCRSVWVALAGDGARFSPRPSVLVSPASLLCPPGWVGLVVIGAAAVVTAPSEDVAARVRRGLTSVPVASLTDPDVLAGVLPAAGTLGPATLAYLAAADFRPAAGSVARVPPGSADVRALLASVSAEDAAESGLDEVTSPVFVVRDEGRVVAAAAYRDWPLGVAHLSALTAPAYRGRGLARRAASAAVASALRDGRLPQWRARPEASRRVAQALGFRELGAQLSVRVRAAAHNGTTPEPPDNPAEEPRTPVRPA
jgi:GNAT superfamily N-acetyltransferase